MSQNKTTYDDVAAHLRECFECVDSSERHLRLNVPVKGEPYPVTVYRGRSQLKNAREVVNIAAPLLNVPDSAAFDVAKDMDVMPVGGLRRLGELLHIHEAYSPHEISGDVFEKSVRFIAAEAADIAHRFGEGE